MERPTETDSPPTQATHTPIFRTLFTGGLMGLANLVPGVSGGTMVLIMGLYDRFIGSVADITRLRFSRSALIFLGLIIAGAGVAIVGLSTVMSYLVRTHESLMYALFIGMTLAGAPLLWKMCRPIKWPTVIAFVVGFGLMLAIFLTEDEGAKAAAREVRAAETFVPSVSIGRDIAGGALAMSAMILPGISGAYMMLILGRYEHITGAVSLLKDIARGDTEHAMTALQILGPVAVGAILSLVLLSNLLKYLLKHHEQPMGGLLLGVLIGSAVAIWPFTSESTGRDYAIGAAACIGGFVAVLALTFFVTPKDEPQT
ncbi:MAG: DUF368 domain-containing protein [Planctomycetota bacterium]